MKIKSMALLLLILCSLIFGGCEYNSTTTKDEVVKTTFEFASGSVTVEFLEEDRDKIDDILATYNAGDDLAEILKTPEIVFPDDKDKQKYWEDKLTEIYEYDENKRN